jgi:tripartite motif-containing protein 71
MILRLTASLLVLLTAGLLPVRPAGAAGNASLFFKPAGVAVDGRGTVYVLDSGHARVVRMSSSGRVLGAWGKSGNDPGDLGTYPGQPQNLRGPIGPAAIALGRRGSVFVADTWNDRIEKFAPSGKLLSVWDKLGLSHPSGIAVDSQGNVYVTNLLGNSVQKISFKGKVLATWGNLGPDDKRPGIPLSIAVAPSGDVYVAVWWTGSEVCDPQSGKCGPAPETWEVQQRSSSGDVLGSWNWPGCIPYYDFAETACPVMVGGSGNIFTINTANPTLNRVEKYTPDGHLLSAWGRSGDGPREFNIPAGLAVDVRGDLYVADMLNNRIQKLNSSGQVIAIWK